MPVVSVLKSPLQVTGLIPPGKLTGTGKLKPDIKTLFVFMLFGIVISQVLVPVLKFTVATVAVVE